MGEKLYNLYRIILGRCEYFNIPPVIFYLSVNLNLLSAFIIYWSNIVDLTESSIDNKVKQCSYINYKIV
jgi:hypothetical protein